MIFSQYAKAQIVQFSQFYSNPLTLAPSYAGAVRSARAVVNYRNQWPETGTFNTYAASYDQHLYKINSGIGFQVLRDEAGEGNLGITQFAASYSWYTNITKDWYIRPGINAKYCARTLNFEKLVFVDMIDNKGNISRVTSEDSPITNKPYMDMAVSLLAYHENYWVGINFDHILTPRSSLFNDQDYREKVMMSAFGGAKFYVGHQSSHRGRHNKEEAQNVVVTALYQYSKTSDQLNIGAYWNKNPFTLGMWMRGIPIASGDSFGNIDAMIFLLGYKIFNLHIGYSYDFSVGELLSISGGAHEISVMYEFEPKAKAKRRHSVIACPKF